MANSAFVNLYTTQGENLDNQPWQAYPRLQMRRKNWMNLNGEWDFLFDFGNSGVERELYRTERFTNAEPRKIIVPFCPESSLSGIGYTDFIPGPGQILGRHQLGNRRNDCRRHSRSKGNGCF